MAVEHVMCDKTELVLVVLEKKKAVTLNVRYDEIQSIRFQPCKEFKFLSKVDSEKIVIATSKYPKPVVYTKRKEKKYFEKYKTELEKFAKNNNITFYNDLK